MVRALVSALLSCAVATATLGADLPGDKEEARGNRAGVQGSQGDVHGGGAAGYSGRTGGYSGRADGYGSRAGGYGSKGMARRRLAPSVKVLRYAQRVVDQHDANGNGRLDESEWGDMEGNPRLADANRDGAITAAEFAAYVARYGFRRRIRLMPAVHEGKVQLPSLLSPTATVNPRKRFGSARNDNDLEAGEPSGATRSASDASSAKKRTRAPRKYTVSRTSLPKGLPSWFLLRDADGDAQLTLAEYARDVSETSIKEFSRYDANGDGVVTPQECLNAPRSMELAGSLSGKAKRTITGASDRSAGGALTDQTEEAPPTGRAVTDRMKRAGAIGRAATDRTGKKGSEKLTKEEIRQRYLNRALLRKSQSNKLNRTKRERDAGSE